MGYRVVPLVAKDSAKLDLQPCVDQVVDSEKVYLLVGCQTILHLVKVLVVNLIIGMLKSKEGRKRKVRIQLLLVALVYRQETSLDAMLLSLLIRRGTHSAYVRYAQINTGRLTNGIICTKAASIRSARGKCIYVYALDGCRYVYRSISRYLFAY